MALTRGPIYYQRVLGANPEVQVYGFRARVQGFGVGVSGLGLKVSPTDMETETGPFTYTW